MLESIILLEENLALNIDSNCILFPRCSQTGNDFFGDFTVDLKTMCKKVWREYTQLSLVSFLRRTAIIFPDSKEDSVSC